MAGIRPLHTGRCVQDNGQTGHQPSSRSTSRPSQSADVFRCVGLWLTCPGASQIPRKTQKPQHVHAICKFPCGVGQTCRTMICHALENCESAPNGCDSPLNNQISSEVKGWYRASCKGMRFGNKRTLSPTEKHGSARKEAETCMYIKEHTHKIKHEHVEHNNVRNLGPASHGPRMRATFVMGARAPHGESRLHLVSNTSLASLSYIGALSSNSCTL